MTLVGPDRWPGSAGLWGRNPRWPAVGYSVVVLVVGLLVAAIWPAILADANVWYAYALALVLTAGWSIAAIQLARLIRDIATPTSVEGKVILHQYIEGYHGGEGPSDPDICRIVVDDGRSDTAPIYNVDGRIFAYVQTGDVVHLTVGEHHGYVYSADILQNLYGPVGPVGLVPALPGAPLPAPEVSRAVHRVVRSIEGPETTGTVRTCTYHLGGDDDSTVRVHLAVGTTGFRRSSTLPTAAAADGRAWPGSVTEHGASAPCSSPPTGTASSASSPRMERLYSTGTWTTWPAEHSTLCADPSIQARSPANRSSSGSSVTTVLRTSW